MCGVLCVVCCVWCVVVVCCGGVLWWCVVKLGTLSLSLSCSLSFLFSFHFFFSLIFLFLFSFSVSLAPSLILALALVLSLSLLSSFFPSTHSSLLFPSRQQNTVQSTDQQTRRPALRRLNVMWRTVRSQQLPTNCTECSHLSSSLLPPSHTQKKERELFITGIHPAREFIFYDSFKINSEKSTPGEITVITVLYYFKQKDCNCNYFVKDGRNPIIE